MGARAYRYLDGYTPAPGCLVEVGSERGEGSTAFLADYAKRHGLRFYTADIDPVTYRNAKKITAGARLCSGRQLLQRLRTPVSVAYLDGFDWIPEGLEMERWIDTQVVRYRKLGINMTNSACQLEHLKEAELVERKAADRCLVICDDTFPEWDGKGGQAVPYLLSKGFKVVHQEEPHKTSLGCVVLER